MRALSKTILYVLCFILSYSTIIYAQSQDVSVWVDGEKKEIEGHAFLENGATYIPMRAIFELLGAEVEWRANLKEVTGIKGGRNVIVKIDSPTAFLNNRVVSMPKPAKLINNRTMVPIRFVSEALGAKVEWDGTNNRVLVITELETEADKSRQPILSYKMAIDKGIKNSPEYKSSIIDSDRASQSNQDLIISPGSYNLALLQAKKDLNLYEKWSEMQIEITADRVGNNIRNQMDAISLLIAKQENTKAKIDFLNYKIRMETLKYEKGLISKMALDNIQSQIDGAVLDLSATQTELNGSYIKLNNMLGLPSSQRDELEYSLDYKKIGEIDLDQKIKSSIENDPYLWYAKENLDAKLFKLTTYEYNVASKSYTLTALDVSEARKNLSETKDALAHTIRQRYNNLLQLEDGIERLELQKEEIKRMVNTARLQYDLGMKTKAETEEVQLNIPDLDYEIFKLKLQHQQLKVLFEKPYFAPEYFSIS